MNRMQEVIAELAGLQEGGEVYMTGNTRSLIEEAMELGLVKPISGKFRAIEPGCLNSAYRLV